MKVSKADALFGKRVNMRRVDDGIARPAQIAVALVVGHDQDDVRENREAALTREAGNGEGCQQCLHGKNGESQHGR